MITKQIIFFSIIAIIVGISYWGIGNRVLAKWKKSEAIVIKSFYRVGANGENDAYAIIRFTTDKNESITKELNSGMSVGEKVSIVYAPYNPQEIVTSPILYFKTVPKVLLAAGAIGLIIATLDVAGIISFWHCRMVVFKP